MGAGLTVCGICGRISFRGEAVARERVERMCAVMSHRGPDATGIMASAPVGLGQCRLSIIDLDERSVAPLSNEDGSVWVTFNGEIYNHRELRRRLVEGGHVFRTETDTEVIVHLYEEYGSDCVHRLRGMFAFALWDARSQTLVAARDRLGKKPFLYCVTSDGLSFASEFAALLQDPDVSSEPDYAAIDEYLRYQYVPSPATAFAAIRKLPAGHLLTCHAAGAMKVERYWAPPAPAPLTASAPEIEEELIRRLREAVRLRLMADVPLGAFLSGGIDSGAVVSLMAEECATPVKTFSLGSGTEERSELPYARQVADRYGTDHHEFMIEPDAGALLPLLVRHYGEPFADSSALPTYYLARETSRHVTVALSGDGGDESFAGYDSYGTLDAWERVGVIPRPLRRAVGASLRAAVAPMPYTNWTARAERAAAMFAGGPVERYELHMTTLKPQERAALYDDSFWRSVRHVEHGDRLDAAPNGDAVGWMMRNDQRTYLPDCLMVKVDIASMANSLEVRAPFLDHELVEFAAAIPSSLKRGREGGKLILRSALRDRLPPDVLNKRKSGFGIPVAEWFRGELLGLLRHTLLSERATRRGMFRPAFIARMIDEHARGVRDWSNRLWALLLLELWFCEMVERGHAG